jgi:hypothetical protein
VSKDRAAPFSKKHRRYWLPVTGGMILIGALNIGLGVCTYEPAGDPEPIRVGPPRDASMRAGSLSISEIPADVMRAFAIKYPKTIPAGADRVEGNIVVLFPAGADKHSATFQTDGVFLSDD